MNSQQDQIKRIEEELMVQSKLLSELLSIVRNYCSPINESFELNRNREEKPKQLRTTIKPLLSHEDQIRELDRRLDLL